MSSENTSPSLAGKRIVIIEDEGLSILAFRRICQQAGLKVVGIASNGKDGVDLVMKERPDIVLIDINMPVMNGVEAARLILERLPVCLIFVTALSEENAQEQIDQIACHGCVVKPVANEILIPAIQKAYRQFQREGAAE